MGHELEGTEKCTSCGKDTGIPKKVNINVRPEEQGLYVEGSGQLCPECAERIYADAE